MPLINPDIVFQKSQPRRAKAAKVAKVDHLRRIQTLWKSTQPAPNTLVETYLKSRGLTLPIPLSLRYLPEAWHAPSEQTLPVMLAAVSDTLQPDLVLAVHRTYLNPDGFAKASVNPDKMMLGDVNGRSVHLAPATEQLAITEGIETGLAVMQATKLPVWAALSAGGIATLVLPPLPMAVDVVICADNDKVGTKKAHEAAERFIREGRQVRVCMPPEKGQDFNDWLMALSNTEGQ